MPCATVTVQPPADPDPGGCTSDTDCATGEHCVDGTCLEDDNGGDPGNGDPGNGDGDVGVGMNMNTLALLGAFGLSAVAIAGRNRDEE